MVNEIINECLDHLISKLEENILIEDFNYGKFSFDLYTSSVKINYIERYYSDNSPRFKRLVEYDFYNEYPEPIWFWYNREKKDRLTKLNKIYNLLNERKKAKERQEQLKQNEVLISCLPEDRQKQIYRESKLKRIIENE